MTDIPVDITGIQDGQTLIWNTATQKLIPGNRTAGSVPRTASSIASLGSGVFDGEQAIIRVGTYPNIHEEPLTWSGAENSWFGGEHVLVTQGDTWAMDSGNRSQAQMEDWSPIDNPVPYGQSYARIDGSLNLSSAAFNNDGSPSGTITVDDTTSPHSFPFVDAAGGNGTYYRIRDNYIIGEVGSGTTLINCAVVQGSRGTIPDQEFVRQGYPGGWGFSSVSLAFAGLLVAAGLHVQERLMSLCNSTPDNGSGEKQYSMAPYWYQYDPGDGTANPSIPPTGGLGVSAVLLSPVGSGGVSTSSERDFFLSANDWSDWPLAAPSKHFLIPRIVGKTPAGAYTSGSCLDTRLGVRWAS